MPGLQRVFRKVVPARARRVAAIALVAAAATISILVGASSVFVGTSGAASGGNCGRVPASKCDPAGPAAGPGNHPTNVAPPTPYWPSDDLVGCATSFFTNSQVSQLEAQFGSLNCFRFQGEDTWVVVSDGMQTTGDGGAPGGAIVATDSCGGDSTCLDPTSTHDFSDFTVAYSPVPTLWPMKLEGTFGDRLIYLGDGACGPYAFDLKNLRWFGGHTSDIDAILGGVGTPRSVHAPAVIPGATAVAQHAPTISQGCSS